MVIQLLLHTAIFGEIGLILALLPDIPTAEPAMVALDRFKRGRGPLIAKIVACSVLAAMVTRAYSMLRIIKRTSMLDSSVLKNMLQISLMGFLLFLSLVLNRLHHYMRKLPTLRNDMDAAKRENQSSEEKKSRRAMELKSLGQEIAGFRTKIKKMESEYWTKQMDSNLEKTNVYALRKQYEGLLTEIDRVQEDNQILRSQLEWIDQSYHDDKTKHVRKRLH